MDLTRNNVSYPGRTYKIATVHPAFVDDLPNGVPANIIHFYSQGLKNLHEQNWDAAGAMFRKTLDTATKFLAPNNAKKSLFMRINKLVEENMLTPAMGEWSHEIRLDGNDAVHDEEPETEDDAKRTQKFSEAFLTYTFSLPAMVATSRNAREEATGAIAEAEA